MITSNLEQKLRYLELVYAMSNPIEKNNKPWTGQQDRPAFTKIAKKQSTKKSR